MLENEADEPARFRGTAEWRGAIVLNTVRAIEAPFITSHRERTKPPARTTDKPRFSDSR
jgi:hypothetical protein